ncbi:MAG TPA: hypothetical protein PKD54_16100 [Pirellulaceae bacterium]|nr:hypothetical protein [Pirellulaceae bacterium]
MLNRLRFQKEDDGKRALELLREAAAANPTSPTADFLLGLGYALPARDHAAAERHGLYGL